MARKEDSHYGVPTLKKKKKKKKKETCSLISIKAVLCFENKMQTLANALGNL